MPRSPLEWEAWATTAREGESRRSARVVVRHRLPSIANLSLVLDCRWVGYRSAKAATNQAVLTLQRELELRATPSIAVALHPGTVVGTNLSAPWTNPKDVGKKDGVFKPEESTSKLLEVIKGLSAEDGGRFLDWAGKDIQW